MNAESKKIWSPSCRVLIDLSPFPQPYISCSFSDEIHDGVKDGLCASDILCRSGCSVWESLGHSAELTHLWYYPTTYSHLIRQKTHRSWSSGAHQYWFPPAAEKLHHRFDKGRWRNRRSDSTLDFHQNTSILSGGQKYTLQTNLKFSPQPARQCEYEASKLPSMFADSMMTVFREGSQEKVVQWVQRIQKPHPTQKRYEALPRLRIDEGLLGQDVRRVTLWQSYLWATAFFESSNRHGVYTR